MTPSNAKDDAVEAVARAMAKAAGYGDQWNGRGYQIKSLEVLARAAIEAMRAAQPVKAVTDAMCEAGTEVILKYDVDRDFADAIATEVYSAMRAARVTAKQAD